MSILNRLNAVNNNQKLETIIEIKDIEVDFIFRFNLCINNIKKFLKTTDDETLIQLRIQLNRLNNVLLSSLNNYRDEFEKQFDKEFWKELETSINKLYFRNPSTEKEIKELNEYIEAVTNNKVENVLHKELGYYLKELEDFKTIAIVNYSMFNDVSNYDYHGKLEFITMEEYISSEKNFNLSIFIGSPAKFRKINPIFKSNRVIYFTYKFFRNDFVFHSTLDFSKDYKNTLYEFIKVNELTNHNPVLFEVEPEETLSIDIWERNYNRNTTYADKELSKLLIMANRKILLVPIKSKVNCLEFGFNNTIKVNYKSIEDVYPGEVIIIRDSVTDDYYESKSREVYGETEYDRSIEDVKFYKKLLKQKSYELGGNDQLKRSLEAFGVDVKSLQLLKNWIEMKTIRPRSLKKILEFLDIDNEKKLSIIKSTRYLNAVHRQVGYNRSQDIEEYIKSTDLNLLKNNLITKGKETLHIEDVGIFKIIKVIEIKGEDFEADINDLNKLINLD